MSSPCWIMPHYTSGDDLSHSFVTQAIASILRQTDPDWHLVIVDDLSPPAARTFLSQQALPPNVHVIYLDHHVGAGEARNAGIRYAHTHLGAPFLLFLDADDVAHPDRLAVTRGVFSGRPDVSVVYSTFVVIDEDNLEVPRSRLAPMIIEHLDSHTDPPVGPNAWIRIATETGYTNLTSATSVRTQVAWENLFCPSVASEDAHCWLRYSAAGEGFYYAPEIPTRYRIPQHSAGGSSSRGLVGKERFYQVLSETNEDGFRRALGIALGRGKVRGEEAEGLTVRFYVRTAETIGKEGVPPVAQENVRKAMAINKEVALEALKQRNLMEVDWVQALLQG